MLSLIHGHLNSDRVTMKQVYAVLLMQTVLVISVEIVDAFVSAVSEAVE